MGKVDIVKYLRVRRKVLEWSQQRLADEMNKIRIRDRVSIGKVFSVQISRVENGQNCSKLFIELMIEALGLSEIKFE